MTQVNFPGTLKDAFASYLILPGSRMLLKPSAHTDDYTNKLTGITVMPYQDKAYIGGGLVVDGSDVIFQNLELSFAGWNTRQSTLSGSAPSDMPLNKGLTINGKNCKFVNCDIHDYAGVGLWAAALGAEFYGNIVHGIGWLGPDRGHGHGLYVQNLAGVKKTIKHNIIFDCFGWGIHVYSSSGNNLQDMDILENTCFRAGSLSSPKPNILVGADRDKAGNVNIVRNLTYGGNVGIQAYGAGWDETVTKLDNHCPEDGDGIGNLVYLYPNEYNANRANLTIYNEALVKNIKVDVSSIYRVGDTVLAKNVQDYKADIQNLIVGKDGIITIDMMNHTVATPRAWTAPASTFPEFGCFVLERFM